MDNQGHFRQLHHRNLTHREPNLKRGIISRFLAGISSLCVIAGMSCAVIPLSLTLSPSQAVAAAPQTPILGVDATAIFGCSITSQNVIDLAHSLSSSALSGAGYNLIEINDCWQTRDQTGHIVADGARFPGGIAPLVHTVHTLGVKLGLSLDLTSRSCGGALGSAGHIPADATSIASWDVDEISVSACDTATQNTLKANCRLTKGELFINSWFDQVNAALHRFPRQILVTSTIPANVAAACGDSSGSYLQALDYASHHAAAWIGLPAAPQNWEVFLRNYANALHTIQYQHPGSFGTASDLAIGQGSLNFGEERSQVALWSLFGSPLILGVDPGRLNSEQIKLLTNRDLLGLDQSNFAFGPAYQIYNDNTVDISARQVTPEKYYAVEFTKSVLPNFNLVQNVPWGFSGNNWIQTNIANGNSTPVSNRLFDVSLGHHVTVLTITQR